MNLYNNDVNFEHKSLLPEDRQGEVLDIKKNENVHSLNYYIESYGCAMNFADSEVVASILNTAGFGNTTEMKDADVIFINTCSIRDKAEMRVRKRLELFNSLKRKKPELLIGVLGCMAERLKAKFLEEEQMVDIVVGPDAYRDLPQLLSTAQDGQSAVNVLLSREETYADISPVRLNSNGITAYISIMRGCDNMCSFCVVPFTRGRERSRNPESILSEAQQLFDTGYREVTLLGQNVDSYSYGEGQKTSFAELLVKVAEISPLLRVRFSTSHPKDITDDVMYAIRDHHNICNYIHLPAQSGNSRILKLMNRTYTREWYLSKIERIRELIPDCAVSTDIITGFCTETEQDHKDTLSLLGEVRFDLAYMFFYSERPGTLAARKYKDDVELSVKKRRLQEVVDLQRIHSQQRHNEDIGKVQEVLVEKVAKKGDNQLSGRNSQNQVVVFAREDYKIGDYVDVEILSATTATLLGKAIGYSKFE